MGTTTIEPKSVKIKGQIKAKEIDGERRIVFVASSNQEDRDYEFVDVKSLRLPLKGGGYIVAGQIPQEGISNLDIPFMLNHSFDVTDVIGSVRRAFMQNDELIFETGLSSRDIAQEMLILLEEDHLGNAMSITMIDYDYSDNKIFNAEVIEVSLVFRGSNKEARLLTVKSLLKGEQMSKDTQTDKEEVAVKETEEATVVEDQVTETVTEKPEEVVEAETEEVEEEVAAEAEAEVEEAPVEEKKVKSKKESKNMSKDTELAVDGVKPKAVEGEVVQGTVPKTEKIDKYDFAAKQFVAWVNKDFKTLSELNKKAIASYDNANSKETYLNAGTLADGGAIVPEAQLLQDVYSTLGEFSTVANDLRVVTLTEGNALDVATLVTDVIVSEVGTEGGDKDVTKPVFGEDEITLREFAGIAIITKKLVRQAAINVFDLLRESFARAIANRRAQMALTDATSGIVNQTGVEEVEAASAGVANYSWSDVKRMPYRVPVAAVQNSKYYISRELLETLDTEEDNEGRDLDILELEGENGLSGRFKNGFRFAVEEELGQNGAPHAVFGSMPRFGILLRQASVESETFDQGTVEDGNEVVHNLIQQNKLAHRVAFYENVGYPLPGAFAVLVDPSASS